MYVANDKGAVWAVDGDYQVAEGEVLFNEEPSATELAAVFPVFIPQLKDRLCHQIDDTADLARLAIAGDPLRVIEYERAALEAQAYKDADYTGTVPPAVNSWAEAKGWSGQQAADNILVEAASWNKALYGLRDMRLKGKETVRNAADIVATQAAADAVINQIRSAVASVVNAK